MNTNFSGDRRATLNCSVPNLVSEIPFITRPYCARNFAFKKKSGECGGTFLIIPICHQTLNETPKGGVKTMSNDMDQTILNASINIIPIMSYQNSSHRCHLNVKYLTNISIIGQILKNKSNINYMNGKILRIRTTINQRRPILGSYIPQSNRNGATQNSDRNGSCSVLSGSMFHSCNCTYYITNMKAQKTSYQNSDISMSHIYITICSDTIPLRQHYKINAPKIPVLFSFPGRKEVKNLNGFFSDYQRSYYPSEYRNPPYNEPQGNNTGLHSRSNIMDQPQSYNNPVRDTIIEPNKSNTNSLIELRSDDDEYLKYSSKHFTDKSTDSNAKKTISIFSHTENNNSNGKDHQIRGKIEKYSIPKHQTLKHKDLNSKITQGSYTRHDFKNPFGSFDSNIEQLDKFQFNHIIILTLSIELLLISAKIIYYLLQ